MQETPKDSFSGIFVLSVSFALCLPLALMFFGLSSTPQHFGGVFIVIVLLGITVLASWSGLYSLEPNQAAVLSLFGHYAGTVKDSGLRWNNPFYAKRRLSLRIRNFESSKLKVNEKEGSPIEIAAVVVWRVVDTAEAVYNVDDFESYVHIQSEAALRAMASSYPYDQNEDETQITLRSHPVEVSHHLQEQIAERLAKAGVEVIEARISHLAYASEIAQAMLQRQQANALVAARTRIVYGAVSMVEMALEELKKNDIIELDDEKKANMVSNLLVVLCSDRATQPVVNTSAK